VLSVPVLGLRASVCTSTGSDARYVCTRWR
jgi:hypothetical protein